MPPPFATVDGFPAGVPGYESLELLGRGTSGSVFKARQRSTGQFVAVKVPHAPPMPDPAATRRLHQRLHHETRLCATLHHPHIVRLVDKGLAVGGRPYAVFEYVPGETLREFLLRRGALPAPEAAALMAQLLDVLAWLHARQIMHRDLKPQNVMVISTSGGSHPKVLDFGIARRLHGQNPPGAGDGTPAYCAPEQLRGEAPSPQADIYAWGLLFVECLTGRAVLHGMTPAEARRWQLGPAAVPLPAQAEDHPLGALLRKVLEKDHLRRAADAAALQRELARAVERRSADAPAHAAARRTGAPPAPETEGGEPAEAPAGRLAMLGVALRLDPGGGALELDDLNALRMELIAWCGRLLDEAGAQPAGALGDVLLFRFAGRAPGVRHVHEAIHAALELQVRARRQGRLLQLRHGVELHVGAGVQVAEPSGRDGISHVHRAGNQALHLAGRAPHARVAAAPEVERLLRGATSLEPWDGAGRRAFLVGAGNPV